MNPQVQDERHKQASARGAARTKELGNSHDRMTTDLGRMAGTTRGGQVSSTEGRWAAQTDDDFAEYARRMEEGT